VLTTSLGRAYFSFSESAERESILAVLSAPGHRERRQALDRAAVTRLVRATRARGYAAREGGQAPGTTSIAVPVMKDGRVLAAINIICIASAVTLGQVVERYLVPMRVAARRIEVALTDVGR
jgi:DNA-binding IclR family transcriptional regulator